MINSQRQSFDRKLGNLLDQLLMLGSMVNDSIVRSLDALERQDRELSRLAFENDEVINRKRYEIENEVIALIATQQPVGKDVRFLAAILEIITELERIGDYAKGISKINLLLPEEVILIPVINKLKTMSEKGLDMLNRSLEAFLKEDVATSRNIPKEDDEVDNLYKQVHYQLVNMVLSDNSYVTTADYLLWAAHNLERLADRVTNICERTVYAFTGEMKELD